MIRRRARPRTATVSTRRLEAFTDGVFAIAATLLVLDLTVNDLSGATTDAELWHGHVGMWPAISSFAISFFLLCLLWSIHVRQFEFIPRVDTTITAVHFQDGANVNKGDNPVTFDRVCWAWDIDGMATYTRGRLTISNIIAANW